MPTCGCTGPCTCAISEDGYFSGHPELGRNFTQISGDGSDFSPYTFSFYDQEEFRPRTTEISFANQTIPNDVYTIIQDPPGSGTPIYQSPSPFLIRDPLNEELSIFEGDYFVFGATATFDQAADATSNTREMLLVSTRGVAGSGENYIDAGQTTPGGSLDPITVSCETLNPGLFNALTGIDGIIGAFLVVLYQNSGAPLGVSDIRVWLTQI